MSFTFDGGFTEVVAVMSHHKQEEEERRTFNQTPPLVMPARALTCDEIIEKERLEAALVSPSRAVDAGLDEIAYSRLLTENIELSESSSESSCSCSSSSSDGDDDDDNDDDEKMVAKLEDMLYEDEWPTTSKGESKDSGGKKKCSNKNSSEGTVKNTPEICCVKCARSS